MVGFLFIKIYVPSSRIKKLLTYVEEKLKVPVPSIGKVIRYVFYRVPSTATELLLKYRCQPFLILYLLQKLIFCKYSELKMFAKVFLPTIADFEFVNAVLHPPEESKINRLLKNKV